MKIIFSDLTNLYLDVIKEHFVLTNETIEIFVLEKPNMNRLTDNSLVKDGIHIIIGIQCNNTVQLMIREEILSQISNIETWSSLPKTNSWNEVFDDGISAGHTNWQMFGSRKPDNEAYQITIITRLNMIMLIMNMNLKKKSLIYHVKILKKYLLDIKITQNLN